MPRIWPKWSPKSNRLDPRPGFAFDPPLAPPVVPDIIMRAQLRGGWAVELNAETLPRVLVNNRYYASIRRTALNKIEREYLTERMQAANWLIKGAAPARRRRS